MKKITKSFKETKEFGKDFSRKIKPGDILLLYGELGAGKTTFTQGIAEGFGIKDRIISPTFVLQRIHDIDSKKIKKLNHIDLYRIEGDIVRESLGLVDLYEDKESVTIIEWAERLKNFMPKKGFVIKFKYLGEGDREIEINVI